MKKLTYYLFEEEKELSVGRHLHFRVLELAVIWFAYKFCWYWISFMDRISDVVLPLGIAKYIDISFMFGSHYPRYIGIALTTSCILGYLRIGTKYMYSIGFICFHLLFVARYSLGEIPHSSNLTGISLLLIALGFMFFKKKEERIAFIFGSIFFFTGLAYTSAGITKLIGTGINWSDGRHLWLWMTEKSVDHLGIYGFHEFNFLQQIAFEYIPFATLILTIGLLTELSGFLFWFRKTRPFIVIGIIGLHVGIFYFMNIWFHAFMVELLILGFPWGRWVDWLMKKLKFIRS
ncbi:hypothetical protein [Ekhidna sp.]|uniref:hypothetical protein n=1 Tax=Ekhidna sp. TaxID=2608089 RepID=UPI003B50F5A0